MPAHHWFTTTTITKIISLDYQKQDSESKVLAQFPAEWNNPDPP
jgi:hypothetical protein